MRRQSARFSSSDRWRRERFFLAHPWGTWATSSPLLLVVVVVAAGAISATASSSLCFSGMTAWRSSMEDMARQA